MDVPVPPTVNTIVPPVSTTRVPLLQIPSVASTANTLPSSQPQKQNVDPSRKCGKRKHSTDRCRKRVTCKNCKGKDHGTRFCTIAPAPDYKFTFCRKGNTLQRTAEQGRKLRRKLGQEDYQSLWMTHWIHPLWLQGNIRHAQLQHTVQECYRCRQVYLTHWYPHHQ